MGKIALHPNQARYLLAEKSSRYSFNIPVFYQIDGFLNIEKLREAIKFVCFRHEASRTCFKQKSDGTYYVRIMEEPEFEFRHIRVDSLNEHEVLKKALELTQIKPDLSRLRELHRYLLFEFAPDCFLMVLSQHHSVSDGMSMEIFIDEVFTIYDDRKLNSCSSFYDYYQSNGEDKEKISESEQFWKNEFILTADLPALHSDVKCENCLSRPNFVSHELWPTSFSDFRALAREHNVSFFNLLAASYALQLSHQTKRANIFFAIQSAGRHHLPENTEVIGPFSNALILHVVVNLKESFLELAKRTKERVRTVLENEIVPYHKIQQLVKLSPRFALNLYPQARTVFANELSISTRKFLNSESDYSINLRWFEEGNALKNVIFYDNKRYSRQRIDAFGDQSIKVLEEVYRKLYGTNGNILAGSFLKNDKALNINNKKRSPPPSRIHTNVFETCRKFPDNVAVRYNNEIWTYRTLLNKILAFSSYLVQKGVKSGDRVAVLSSRDSSLIVAVLSISNLNASFAILDYAYPGQRLLEYCGVLKPDFLLLTKNISIPGWLETNNSSTSLKVIKYIEKSKITATDPVDDATEDSRYPAYFLFTSGTTGTPKCVAIPHGPLQKFVDWQIKEFTITADDCFTMLSGLGHDPVLRDIFTPLSSGACLTIPSQEMILSPIDLVNWMLNEEPTVCHLTPPMGILLLSVLESRDIALCSFRYLFWGGDILFGDLLKRIRNHFKEVENVNFYGATETPQAVCFYRDNKKYEWNYVPIGQQLQGITVDVVAEDGRCCEVNEVGEICVSTSYEVSLIESGSSKAMTNKLKNTLSEYMSGDLGYYLPTGDIILIGRVDDQVKIRGNRIELNEISSKLLRLDSVSNAVTVVCNQENDFSRIYSYVELTSKNKTNGINLRRHLEKVLPDHMVPSSLIILDKLPLLPNGKVDRDALPLPDKLDFSHLRLENQSGEIMLPQTDLEKKILSIFQTTSGHNLSDIRLSFRDFGADSLSTVEALVKLESLLKELPEDWIEHDVRSLARDNLEDKTPFLNKIFQIGKVEPHFFMRAIAIVVIVALHFKWFSVGGGMTFILFIISGYSIGKYQLFNVLYQNSTNSLLQNIFSVTITSIPIVVLVYFGQKIIGQPAHLSTLFFYANFLDFDNKTIHDGRIIWLWFIACYIQVQFLIYLGLSWGRVKQSIKRNPYFSILKYFLLSAPLRFAIPFILNPTLMKTGVVPLTSMNYLPTTHLPSILLGVLIALSKKGKEKLLTAAIAFIYILSVNWYFKGNNTFIVFSAVVIILYIKNIRLPRIVMPVALAISSASLYIYLMHAPLHKLLMLIHFPEYSGLMTIIVIIGSIVLWRGWTKILSRIIAPIFGQNKKQTNKFPEL